MNAEEKEGGGGGEGEDGREENKTIGFNVQSATQVISERIILD